MYYRHFVVFVFFCLEAKRLPVARSVARSLGRLVDQLVRAVCGLVCRWFVQSLVCSFELVHEQIIVDLKRKRARASNYVVEVQNGKD